MKATILQMPSTLPLEQIFHFAMVVPDIEKAKEQMADTLGIDWSYNWDLETRLRHEDGKVRTHKFKASYSIQGPPYIELLSGPPGSWYSAAETGPRYHHAGMFVADVQKEVDRLVSKGMRIIGQGVNEDGSTRQGGGCFLTNDMGIHLELLHESLKATLDNWLFPNGMPERIGD